MNLIYLETLLLLFYIYSFCGWFIESTGDFIKKKKFINRGFLMGPYCPIYGTGVILITLLLSKYAEDIFALFLLSMVLCGVLEYLTSYVMEKVFKARWWDYSKMRFNINGRICLETLVLFGISGVAILHYLNPFFISIIEKLPHITLHIISSILLILFIIDAIFSLNIINSVKSIKLSVSNQIKDNTDEISTKVREIIMKKSAPYRRLISAFPQAFADKIKESKTKIEQTAEKVKENIQDAKTKAKDTMLDVKESLQGAKEKAVDNIQTVKDNTLYNIQNVKDKVSDNIQIVKDKTKENIKDLKDKTLNSFQSKDLKKENNKNKFYKTYKTNIKLSLMNIYKKHK